MSDSNPESFSPNCHKSANHKKSSIFFYVCSISIINYFQLVNPSNPNEDAIADKIKTRLADVPGIPFIDIIKAAFNTKKYGVVKRVK